MALNYVSATITPTDLGHLPHAADLGLRPADRVAAVPTLSDNPVELVSL